jgi:hypothetical protein
MENSEEAVLRHIGILGMKWGRRKADSSGGSSGGSSRGLLGGSKIAVSKAKSKLNDDDTEVSEDHKKVNELKKKKAKQLSNAEMQSVITRLQLEKSFNEARKSQMNAGQKFVTDLLITTGKQEAQKYVSAKGASIVSNLLKKGVV